MKSISKIFTTLAIAVIILGASSCNKEEAQLEVSINGLEDLGDNYKYEGWLIVDGAPITAGIFSVDANGNMSETSFTVNEADLSAATKYVLTIEPSPDSDPGASSTHVLAGDFSGNTATITVGDGAALGSDFTASTGGYIIATPTTADMTDENSGVWFVDPVAGAATLDLPTLPAGWAYEGWAVIDGAPVSTGTFTSLTGADNAAPFSGAEMAPPFPGEDFINNAPAGTTFPTDLANGTIVISIEPSPDNSPAPFVLKPLVGMVPAAVVNGTVYDMGNNATATNPTGSVSRN